MSNFLLIAHVKAGHGNWNDSSKGPPLSTVKSVVVSEGVGCIL